MIGNILSIGDKQRSIFLVLIEHRVEYTDRKILVVQNIKQRIILIISITVKAVMREKSTKDM